TGDGQVSPGGEQGSRVGGQASARGSGLEAAIGRAVRPEAPADLSAYQPGDAAVERARLLDALDRARESTRELEETTRRRVGAAEADIFSAHLTLLEDPDLGESALAEVAKGRPAPEAWRERVEALRGRFEQLTDPYQRERAQDVSSIGEL